MSIAGLVDLEKYATDNEESELLQKIKIAKQFSSSTELRHSRERTWMFKTVSKVTQVLGNLPRYLVRCLWHVLITFFVFIILVVYSKR